MARVEPGVRALGLESNKTTGEVSHMRFISLLGALALLQAGQDTSKTIAKPGPTIRIYNAAHCGPDVKLDYLLDGEPVVSALAADSISGPFSPKDPKKALLAIRKSGATESLLELPVDASTSDHVLVLVGDPEKKLECADLSIKLLPEADGQPRINVLSAIPKDEQGGDVDIYVLGANDKADSAMPMAKAIAYKASASIPVPPGTYTVVVTKAGSKDVIATSEPIEAKAKDRRAAILIPKLGENPDKVVFVSLTPA
jgi:hypothetical protein